MTILKTKYMDIKQVQTPQAPQAIGPYSQAIIANGFIFCSGQVGRLPEGAHIADDITKQTHQVLKNLQAVLKEAGSDLEHVVKTTIFLANVDDFSKMNEVYAMYFGNTKPARATIEISKIPQGNLPSMPLIEIEAIALMPQ